MPNESYNENLDTAALSIEMAMPVMLPWLRAGASMIDTNEFTQSVHFQRTLGDFLFPLEINEKNGIRKSKCVEFKGERKYTGNLFIETWSNRVRGKGRDGWIHTSRADWLVMVYLDSKIVFLILMDELWDWCFEKQNLYKGTRKDVTINHSQKNKTCGVPVPFSELMQSMNIRVWQQNQNGAMVRLKNLTEAVAA